MTLQHLLNVLVQFANKVGNYLKNMLGTSITDQRNMWEIPMEGSHTSLTRVIGKLAAFPATTRISGKN
jgi:hypothetical protein